MTIIRCDNPDAYIQELQNRPGVVSITSKATRISETADRAVESKPAKRKAPRNLVATVYVPPACWLVGIETFSEANLKKVNHSSITRIATQRKAVQAALAPDWRVWGPIADDARDGKPVMIQLATLGCRQRDRWDNLPRSLKAVLDGVCLTLGIDDGIPNLTVQYDQLGLDRVGVRITLQGESNGK